MSINVSRMEADRKCYCGTKREPHQQYAVSPDIRRFLMIRATESNRLDNLVAVENFFEVLRAKVPRR